MDSEDGSVTPVEGQIARIAGRQHGIVTRTQLLSAGVTPTIIQTRMDRGTLLPVHRGVYRVGHPAPSTLSTYMAAVLACGDAALLCGLAAAHLHQLLRGRPPTPEVSARVKRQVPGIATHRARHPVADRVVVRAIPVTSVARTIVDVAGRLSDEDLGRVVHEAATRPRMKARPPVVEAVLARMPTRPAPRNCGRC